MKFIAYLFYIIISTSSDKALEIKHQTTKGEQTKDYLAELKEELVKVWPNNKTLNIIFHGHSVPSGYFKTPHVNTIDAYPHLFLHYIKKEYKSAVVNCITTSIGGEQAEQGALRFKKEVLNMRPELIFIDYALNDRGIGIKRSETAWRSMIENAISEGVKVVLLTPTPDLSEDILDENTLLHHHSAMIRKLGKGYKIPVVDVYQAFKKLREKGENIEDYMSQRNHPNKKGHEMVANEIVNELF